MSRLHDFRYTLDPSEIPTKKLNHVTGENGPHCEYACPDNLWSEHFEAWCREYRRGNKTAPQPESPGHCMFEHPAAYGMVPWGCTDETKIRKAWESRVRGWLDGWDRDLTKEQLDRIVNATVDAKLAGQDVGASPWMACVYANL